jgi:hypothetical protein
MRAYRGFGFALALALAGGAASAQMQSAIPTGDPVIAELKRKGEAREPENGFCTGRGWPAGNPTSYTAWLEAAEAGSSKVNTFKNGAQCQHDEVIEVYPSEGRKCVRYRWHACERGKTCAWGNSLACKKADGSWDTKG